MNDFDKKLDFDSNTFENMKHDMNFVLQRLLGNMIEKQSNEGSMTIKIDVTMVKEFIPNYDPNIKGESREISKPQFKHKVTSAVKITDEKGGNLNNEMEMVSRSNRRHSSLGDCTNNGISSYARELYILDAQKGPFEPDDIRQCVYIEKREIMGQEYVDCKPAYCRKRWYMAGGNILYTSDSRFKQITGISYPIAIHDRYEGR